MRTGRLRQSVIASFVGAGLCLGGGHFALAQSVRVEFPAKADPTELLEVWPEEAGVGSEGLVKLSHWIRDQKLDVRSLVVVNEPPRVDRRLFRLSHAAMAGSSSLA
jgi:hypothetical protein